MEPWTFTGTPSDDTADGRRDAVRLMIGDTDTTDKQLNDTTIAYLLGQESDRVIYAAISACRMLIARYSREVSTSLQSARLALSDRVMHYQALAKSLETEARRNISGPGAVRATGISITDMETARNDPDRVGQRFLTDQFNAGGSSRRIERGRFG